MKTVATYSIKGGVGKTTAAVNLAAAAAEQGVRVLLWDLDPQGAATFSLRVKPKVKGGAGTMVGRHGELGRHLRGTDLPSLDVVPSDFSMRHLDVRLDDVKHPARRLAELLDPEAEHYDLAILDCAPSISLVSESVFGAADALLVPTIPTPLSARTLGQLTDFLVEWEAPPAVLPFFSIVDRRRKLQRTFIEQLRAEWPHLLHAELPNSTVFERMGTERAPVTSFAPRSAAAESVRALWQEIAVHLW